MDTSKRSQRAVVQFLTAEDESPVEIYRRMQNVYGTVCLSRTSVFRWCSEFRKGRTNTDDKPRPGQAHMVITRETITAVDNLVRNNRRITTREIVATLSISKGSVHTIHHERLEYRKVCAQWVPKHLTEEQKTYRMGACMQHLLRYNEKGDHFLSRIVAADETWCHHFDPATKRMSMEWRHPSSPRPKKARSSMALMDRERGVM
jgi:histone-lysine N-methyltransferase SETMAR